MSCGNSAHRHAPKRRSIYASLPTVTASQPNTSPARRSQNPSRLPDTETLSPIRVNALATRWRGVAALLASCSSAG